MISLSKLKSLISMPILNKLAIEYNVNADNNVRLPGQTVFVCLLNSILNHPVVTQRILEEQFTRETGKSCDHSSFGKRLAVINSEYFRAIFDQVRAKVAPYATKSDLQALKLHFVDATIVTLSAKLLEFGLRANHGNKGEKRHVKSVVELCDDLPNLLHVCDEQSEFSDMIAIGRTIKSVTKPCDLWVFDKGCHGKQLFLDLDQAGSYWLTPHSTQTLKVIDKIVDTGKEIPEAAPKDGEPDCILHKVELATFEHKAWNKMPGLEDMQIVIIHCYRYDGRDRCWKPLVLMTNLPLSQCRTKAGPYSFEEIAQIYRRRWDIEVFFKLLKQHLNYDHLTSRSENGIKVMILMSMITSLLMIWYKQQTEIDRGWRSVKFWLAENVREWTKHSLRHTQFRASP